MMKGEIEKLSDKDLHCLARNIQSLFRGEGILCLYCKYAFQCREIAKETKKLPFYETWDKLQKITGVDICLCSLNTKPKDFLKASWIESFPELHEKFSNMSFEEQIESFCNPEILKYADNYCFENREG